MTTPSHQVSRLVHFGPLRSSWTSAFVGLGLGWAYGRVRIGVRVRVLSLVSEFNFQCMTKIAVKGFNSSPAHSNNNNLSQHEEFCSRQLHSLLPLVSKFHSKTSVFCLLNCHTIGYNKLPRLYPHSPLLIPPLLCSLLSPVPMHMPMLLSLTLTLTLTLTPAPTLTLTLTFKTLF